MLFVFLEYDGNEWHPVFLASHFCTLSFDPDLIFIATEIENTLGLASISKNSSCTSGHSTP